MVDSGLETRYAARRGITGFPVHMTMSGPLLDVVDDYRVSISGHRELSLATSPAARNPVLQERRMIQEGSMNQKEVTGACGVLCTFLVTALVLLGAAAAWSADKRVILMWVGKSGMAKRVATGFVWRMKELAPNVELIQHRELDGMASAERIFKEAETSSNGIVFLRSNGAEFLGRLASPPNVPCFVGGCNNPLELGAVKNLNAPEGMITGVTYFIPYEKRFEAIRSLFPNVKSVCLLLQKGHPSTPIEQAGTNAQCKRHGMAYHEVVADNVGQLVEGARHLSGQVDLFIISSTALVIDNLMSILGIANPSKKPVFSYANHRTEKGATAELAANDEKLGKMLAESVVEIVVKGTPISKVPVKLDTDPMIIVNRSMVSALGLTIPEAVLRRGKVVE